MQELKITDLKDFDRLYAFCYSNIYKCSYNERYYVYKGFDNKYVLSNILNKLKQLSKLHINGSILPKYLVIDDYQCIVAYLTEWQENLTLCEYISKVDINIKINLLKDLKKNISCLHNLGIIHGVFMVEMY